MGAHSRRPVSQNFGAPTCLRKGAVWGAGRLVRSPNVSAREGRLARRLLPHLSNDPQIVQVSTFRGVALRFPAQLLRLRAARQVSGSETQVLMDILPAVRPNQSRSSATIFAGRLSRPARRTRGCLLCSSHLTTTFPPCQPLPQQFLNDPRDLQAVFDRCDLGGLNHVMVQDNRQRFLASRRAWPAPALRRFRLALPRHPPPSDSPLSNDAAGQREAQRDRR
jgi:hypothetical protein